VSCRLLLPFRGRSVVKHTEPHDHGRSSGRELGAGKVADQSSDPTREAPAYEPTRQIPAGPPPPPPPPSSGDASPDGRRWKTWQLIVASLVSLLLGIGIGGAGTTDDDAERLASEEEDDTTTTTEAQTTTTSERTTTSTTASTTTTTTAPPPPPPPQGDREVASFSGSGQHATRPFSVPDGWEVQWDFSGDILQIYVSSEGGDLAGIAANQQGSGSGSSFQARGGSYYLEINAIGDWTVRVVEVN
jgi:hypothetical protein